MGSPYAQSGGAGGSAYAQSGGTAGGTPPKHGGGIGGFFGDVGHWIADKSSLAGHDIYALPTGIIHETNTAVVQPWKNLFTTGHPFAHGAGQNIDKLVNQVGDSTKYTVDHPAADPFQTLLLALPAAHGAGRVAEKGLGVDRTVPRVLRQGDATVGMPPRSKNGAVAVGQHLYDKTLQGALDKNEAGAAGGRVANRLAGHGAKRLAGQTAEAERPRQALRKVVADDLEHAGKELRGRLGNHSFKNQRLAQLSLDLTSKNVTPREAQLYHMAQIAKGVAPKANLRLAKLYRQMHEHEMLTQDEHGNVVVNAEKFPRLAAVDERLAGAQKAGDKIVKDYGLMSEAGAKARIDLPGQIMRAVGRGPVGNQEPIFRGSSIRNASDNVLRKRLDVIEKDYNNLVESGMGAKPGDYRATTAIQNGRLKGVHATVREQLLAQAEKGIQDAMRANPEHPAVQAWTKRLGEADTIKAELSRRADAAFEKPSDVPLEGRSIYGPEGRGYTSQQVIEKRAPKSAAARAPGPVVGVAKSPIPSTKTFTGEAMAQGKVPANTTRMAAQHLRSLIRYVNTSETRNRWLETGSDTRRSQRDILVRKPGETAEKLSPEYEAMLGKGKLTAAENEAHMASLREYLNHLVPGAQEARIRDWEKQHDIGAPAPAGYKWVDENVLGDLKNAFAESRGKPGRAFDNINSAVTAMTVYFKIGHVGTRVLTNAASNIAEGSIKHAPFSMKLWRALTPAARLKALAASGQHGFMAMPHEGEGFIGKAARGGANWWAKHADAPFRFNAVAYEAAKEGFKTPTEFRDFLAKLEDPKGLAPLERVRIENIAKRTNRENISYDRLSERERRFISRGLWFYPWVKGSTAYTMRAILEHPFKAAFAGQAAQQGKKVQAEKLGDLPSYEFGLTPFGHNKVANFSTFSPFATAADLLQLPKYKSAADQLNPAAGALLHLATRTNQYGAHSNAPLADAFKALLAPTPEFQIAEAASGKRSKMFPTSNPALTAFLRMLIGPATPRRVDPAVLNNAAVQERIGR